MVALHALRDKGFSLVRIYCDDILMTKRINETFFICSSYPLLDLFYIAGFIVIDMQQILRSILIAYHDIVQAGGNANGYT